MADVEIIRSTGRQVEALPEIAPAGQEALRTTQRLGQALGQLGDNVYQRVEDNAFMQAQTTLSREVSRIERDNMGNPAGLQKSMAAFKKTFLKEVKIPALRSRLDYQFEAQAIPALNRAQAQFQANVDQETQVNTFLSFEDIQNQMDIAAQGAFSPDPNIAQSSMAQMQTLMERQQALSNQRSSDGSYLFSPEAVANMTIAARDKTHTSLVKTWFKNQPNKLQAAEDWLNGGVQYDLPNSEDVAGGMNLDTLFENGLIQQESGWDQSAVSPKGATGIAQIMPETGPEAAKLAGVAWDAAKFKTDAAYNKQLGRAYFDAQVQKYGDPTLALMAYNAGPGAVDDFMNGTNKTGKNSGGLKIGDPRNGEISVNAFVARFPFKETRDYVRGVKEKAGFTVVNVRETMPASTRQKVDNEIMSMLQDQMAIENHKLVLQERADKSAAESAFTGWVQELSNPGLPPAGQGRGQDGEAAIDNQGGKGQDVYGPFSPEQDADNFLVRREEQIARLDSQKQTFVKGGMIDEYLALRKSLVSGEPIVEDGATILQMKNMMARGQDISQIALGSLNGGRIGTNTYDELMGRQKVMRGPAGDAPQFLLSQIQSSIAGLTPSGDPNSAVLVYNAQTQFLDAVEQWKADPANAGKAPTLKDLKPLADNAISSYNPNPDGAVISLTAPSYIPANMYSAPSVDTVGKMKTLVRENYTKKYGENLDKIKSDPDFIRDFEWVKKIEQTVTPSRNSVGE